jgi:hypothetical protein
MGVWGTALFSDDLASDLRDDYKSLLSEGFSTEEAKVRILKQYKSSLVDSEEAGVFWIALAAVMWQYGRLDDETLQNALAVIDSGEDLKRWENSSRADFKKRKEVLEKLRTKISSSQPIEKQIKRQEKCECNWSKGDLVSYLLPSGIYIIFRIYDFHTDQGGTYPECEMLDWCGKEFPPAVELVQMGYKSSRADYKHTITKIMLCGLGSKTIARFDWLGLRSKPHQKKKDHPLATVVNVKGLDAFLKEWFLME